MDTPRSHTLSDGQLAAISAIERSCSVFSLLGCIFVIVTFCASSAFHKPINRLVFYASFGNMMTNVGTLISRAYLADTLSAGCQFQAFLIQMFMPADAFWTLAMAVNVYLTFYYKFDAVALRRMEIPYLILCYGVPLIPAFIFIFVSDHNGTRVYGNALLWCWISNEWDVWRIASFYGPVWVVMVVTIFIYSRAGRTIYEKHKQLREFRSSDQDPNSVNGDGGIYSVRTTEVTVTSEIVHSTSEANPFEPSSLGRHTSISAYPQPQQQQGQQLQAPSARDRNGTSAYSVHITSNSIGSTRSADDVGLPIQGSDDGGDVEHEAGLKSPATTSARPISTFTTVPPPARAPRAAQRPRNHDINNAAWSYTKCSILFFTAILVTWIPSSANRVYSVINKNENCVALEFMSAFVLPLQGFWNAIIYAVTSWSACRNLFADLRSSRRPEITELVGGMPPSRAGPQVPHSVAASGRKRVSDFLGMSKSKPSKPFDTESATELSTSRETSADGTRR